MNMKAMETTHSSGESGESSEEQLESGIQSLSEMSGGFDASAAAERVRMKKEELSAKNAEDAESEASEASEVAPIDGPEATGAEEEAFDAGRAVDGKKFEGFFTPDEEKAIYVNALEEDVAKYQKSLDREKKRLAEWQAEKPKPWEFSRRKNKEHAIEVISISIEEYTRKLERAQKRLNEVDSLSLEEISGKLGDLVEGEIRQARNEVYRSEQNNYYVGECDSFGSYMADRVARRAADKAPLLERTRWKEYGFMRGESSDDGSTPGKLYKTSEQE